MTQKALIIGVVGGLILGMLFKKLALGLLLGIVIAYLVYRSNKADADQR
ncbi:MAG TPA: hypothetical protein VK166_11625 [Chitinophagaceae bacterium]|nr:hypothetical protein [Chitinophagaceae bacterium]